MLLWEAHKNGNHYALKSAGGSRRLYRNGVFHSQCHLNRIANGGVWDMLWMPCFMQRDQKTRSKKPKRILLLGVGLGASLLKLRTFLPDAIVTAVDIDSTHLQLAKSLIKENASLLKRTQAFKQLDFVRGDAVAWLQSYREPSFDIIVDDLFVDGPSATATAVVSADPSRVIGLNEILAADKEDKKSKGRSAARNKRSWLSLLYSNLNSQGALIANCESASAVTDGYQAWSSFSKKNQGAALRTEHYENRVAFFLKGSADKERANISSFDRAAWLYTSRKVILESDWAEQSKKSQRALNSELGKVLESIKIRKYS